MALRQIGEADLAGKGVAPLPDVPGLPAEEMKAKFEEVVREVVIPAVNENAANSYDKEEVRQKIGEAVLEAGAADMVKSVYDPQGRQGDIFAYADEVGLREYAHVKTGTEHTLEGEGANIRFAASAGYDKEDTFTVNGEAREARTLEGRPLGDGYFVEGALVNCFLYGGILWLPNGGGRTQLGTLTPKSGYALNATYLNSCTKDALGRVVIGAVISGTTDSIGHGTLVATVPEGFRPGGNATFSAVGVTGGGTFLVKQGQVKDSGEVYAFGSAMVRHFFVNVVYQAVE